MEFTATQIAEFLHGEIQGNALVKVHGIAKIEEGDLIFRVYSESKSKLDRVGLLCWREVHYRSHNQLWSALQNLHSASVNSSYRLSHPCWVSILPIVSRKRGSGWPARFSLISSSSRLAVSLGCFSSTCGTVEEPLNKRASALAS